LIPVPTHASTAKTHRRKKPVHLLISLKTSNVLVAFSLVLLLSGCATGENASGDKKEPQGGGIRKVTNETQVTRLIDAYLPSSSELLQIMRFQHRALNRCFAEHGVTAKQELNPTDLEASVNGDIRERATRTSLWGFFDTSNAAQHGYKKPLGEDGGMPVKDRFDNFEPAVLLDCIDYGNVTGAHLTG